MKHSIFPFLFFIFSSLAFSQANTEVYLFDINASEDKLEFSNKKNISNNEGYDSQPSFYNDSIVLFSTARNGKTDIGKYDAFKEKLTYINNTPSGGEYSPLRIPNSKNISAVRLDDDGKQRLYSYDFNTGESKELIENRIVAYYVWANKKIIIGAVIEGGELNLRLFDLEKNRTRRYATNVGRSFHKIPNSEWISFVSKEPDDWWLSSINPSNGSIKKLFKLPGKIEDICWLNDGTALIPSKNRIFKMNPKTDKVPTVIKRFNEDNLQNITRIATNASNTKIAFVSDISAEVIVQQQLDAYNSKDINAFLTTYSKDIKLYYYPNQLFSEGLGGIRSIYGNLFDKTPDLNAKLLSRTVIGNKVIDHELVTANGSTFKAVAIYEVENGLINKVTFIR